MVDLLPFFLFSAIVVLIVLAFFLFKKNQLLEEKVNNLLFSKSSQSVRFGKMSEQFMPFLEGAPFSSNNFRFLGNPIDGIAFEEDKIIFCEFKTGSAILSEKQKKIKELVKGKKVFWAEYRLSEKTQKEN